MQERSPGPAATTLGILATVLFVAAFSTGQHWLLVLAMILAAAGGLLFVSPHARALLGLGGSTAQPQVGLGATVAGDAVLEPGARVEMGATVGRHAHIRSGAVVRMGATVAHDAVVERNATVSWGAMVGPRAVIEEGATVGAGADVLGGARLPAGMWLKPGSTYGAKTPRAAVAAPKQAAEPDPRQARVAAVCDRLEAELRASPERIRQFLGSSETTVRSLRSTCEDLARREREMRADADPAALARLDEERSALQERIDGQPDEQIRKSLSGALAAIDEQKRQREMLKLAADRLEAEHTRLLYTLEGLASQFARLRGAGAQGSPAELEQAVGQLRSELDAIADALEETTRVPPPENLRGFAEAPVTGADAAARPRERTRSS
jgi:carbonic anhydrase/acetyltransferase-like protein (isoleucine patch superfamily)